jgi:hypothetical protein
MNCAIGAALRVRRFWRCRGLAAWNIALIPALRFGNPFWVYHYYFLVLHAYYLYSVRYEGLIRYALHPHRNSLPLSYPSLSLDPRKAAARWSKPAARRTRPPARQRDSGCGAERRRSDWRRDCGRDAGGVHEHKVSLELWLLRRPLRRCSAAPWPSRASGEDFGGAALRLGLGLGLASLDLESDFGSGNYLFDLIFFCLLFFFFSSEFCLLFCVKSTTSRFDGG